MNVYTFGLAIASAITTLVTMVCITYLLGQGIAIPDQLWALLGGGGTGTLVGSAFGAGAAIASKNQA